MKFKEIYDPIFKQNFLIYYDCEFQEFHKEVTGEEYKGNIGVLDGYTINTDDAEICVWLRDICCIPVLIHELCHAMRFALYDRCYIDCKEAELPAYYLEFLVNEVLK